MSNVDGDTKFNIRNTKRFVSIVTLAAKDNVKSNKKFRDELKRSIYCNIYVSHGLTQNSDNNNAIKIKSNSSP